MATILEQQAAKDENALKALLETTAPAPAPKAARTKAQSGTKRPKKADLAKVTLTAPTYPRMRVTPEIAKAMRTAASKVPSFFERISTGYADEKGKVLLGGKPYWTGDHTVTIGGEEILVTVTFIQQPKSDKPAKAAPRKAAF